MGKQENGKIEIQERDIAILRGFFESRVMTSANVADIYFEGRREAAKKRLQAIKAAGLLTERYRRPSEPAILSLSRKGIALLEDQGVLLEYPALGSVSLHKRSEVSDLTIRHELAVMNVKAAFYRMLPRDKGYSISEFSTWPRLHRFDAISATGGRTTISPDGFIRICWTDKSGQKQESSFFLEVDMSTETQETLISRAYCYYRHNKVKGGAAKCGVPHSVRKENPFRVLMIFKTGGRRDRMATRLRFGNPPIRRLMCLATIESACQDPFGPIWTSPADHATPQFLGFS